MDPLRDLLAVGNVVEARALATARVAANPVDAAALVALAKLALADFDADGALLHVAQAEAIGITADTLVIRAGLAIGAGDLATAAASFRKATELQPSMAEAFMGLGLCLANQRQFSAALEALKQAVALEPTSSVFHYHLGQCYLELEDIARAAEHLGRSIGLDPSTPSAYVSLSRCLTITGNHEAARNLVQQGLAILPNNAQLIAELTNLSLVGGDPAGAVEAAHRLARGQPDNPLAQNNLALMWIAQRRFAEVIALCRSMEAKGHTSAGLKMSEATALECQTPPDYDGAARALEQAMALDPTAWAPANNLGLLLLSRPDGDKAANVARAISILEQATRREPGQLEPLLNLAIAYARTPQKQKAKELAQLILSYNLPAKSSVREQAQRLVKALSA